MKTCGGFSIALLVGAALCAQPARDHMVVVISLDGFPASKLADPKIPIPTLRRLAGEGAFAPRMTGQYPTVTWPAHTTMITGTPPATHGVLYNGMLFREGPSAPPKVVPWRPQPEMVKAPTVYELAYRSGLTTAEVDWVAIFESPFLTWKFPEVPNPDGAIESEMIAAGLVSRSDILDFNRGNIVWRDHIWTEAAAHIIEKHRPNLVLFHNLDLDSVNHRYGPDSVASINAMELSDKHVARLVDAVRAAGLMDRTTFIVVADHGFREVKKLINGNALLKANGLIEGTDKAPRCQAWAIPEGGSAMVYVTDRARRGALVPRLKQMFTGVEGVERIYASADFAALGLPLPEKYDQMADLLIATKPGYAFAGGKLDGPVVAAVPPGETPGSHGYLAADPQMDTFFIAWGKGVRRGARLGTVRNVDVAPTIAHILGLRMSNVNGRVLTAAFE